MVFVGEGLDIAKLNCKTRLICLGICNAIFGVLSQALLMEANEGFQADCTKTVEAIDEDQSRRKSGNEVVFALNKRCNRKTINQRKPSDDKSEAGQSLLRTQSLELEKQRSSSENFIRQTKSMSTRCIINVDEFITDALGSIYENGSVFTRGASNQMDLPLSFHLPTMHHYHEGPLGRSVTAHAWSPDSSPGWESRDIKPTLPISLRFQDVKYKVPAKGYQKGILHGVSGSVHPGEILALIGPSGGGKTTLLNLLSGRSKINSGMITYNDKPYCKSLKHRIGFVLQDDAVFPHLTVKETLIYAARLRLSKTLTREQKTERAMNVIRKLGLERCQDTIIGSSHVRGVSGGERKRVCIGNEILLNPSLLFLDEPTSGLDSATALRIVQMLHDIAKSGKTVITTIHQPSSRLFSMFDKLILLGKGSSLYSGKASEAMTYFSSLGCSPLIDMNPAEFLIDLANGNINDKSIPTELEDRYSPQSQNLEIIKTRPSPVQVHEYLVGAYEARAVETQKPNLRKRSLGQAKLEKEPNSEEPGATWWEQFSILFTRGFKERRHEYFSAVRVTQVISTAIIIGLLWWHTSASYMGGLEDQAGLLFFISVFWGFLPLLTAIFTFPQERVMLTKERSVGMYKLSAYFAARIGTDIPLDLVLPIVFMLIVYFMAGLKPSFAMFFLTMLTIFLSILAAQGLGLTIGAAFMDVKKASTLASVILMTFMLSGGFFIQDVPSFMSWVRYVSFNYHTYKLLLRIHGSISSDGGTRSSVSMIVDNSVGAEVAALITMIVGYRLLAYFFLTRMKLKTVN